MYASCYLVLREHSQWFGGDSEEVTPVPMPNTEVKLFSADGSRGFPPVRVGRRQAILTQFMMNWVFYMKDLTDIKS